MREGDASENGTESQRRVLEGEEARVRVGGEREGGEKGEGKEGDRGQGTAGGVGRRTALSDQGLRWWRGAGVKCLMCARLRLAGPAGSGRRGPCGT